jgi:hypothetical protein
MAQRQQAADQFLADRNIDMHFGFRGLLLQGADRGHDITHRSPCHRPDAHDAAASKAQTLHLVRSVLQVVQDVARAAGKPFSGIGQLHAFRVTFEQRHTHTRLGLGQGAGGGGLRQAQGLRRDGHLPMLGNRRDQPQMLQVQVQVQV